MFGPFGLYEDDLLTGPPDLTVGAGGEATPKEPEQPTELTIMVDGKEEKIDLSDKENVTNLLQQGRRLSQLREADKLELKRIQEDFDSRMIEERHRVDELIAQRQQPQQTVTEPQKFVDQYGEPDELTRLRHEQKQDRERTRLLEKKVEANERAGKEEEKAYNLRQRMDAMCEDYPFLNGESGKNAAALQLMMTCDPKQEITDRKLRAIAEGVNEERKTYFSDPKKWPEEVRKQINDAAVKAYLDGKTKDKHETRGTGISGTGPGLPSAAAKPPTVEQALADFNSGKSAKDAEEYIRQLEEEG